MNTRYETNSLILAICNVKNAGQISDFYNKNFDEFALYEPLPKQAHTISYHKKNLELEYNLFLKGQFVRFFLFEKHNPITVIGTVSYREIRKEFYDSCLIGYKMDKSNRRQGYCREAISFLDTLVFTQFGLNRIEATVQPQNIPSIKLLESLGYTNEGLLREKIKIDGTYKDHYLFSRLKKDVKNI